MIDPFANDSQSMQIGDLVIENQTDKITIYGDIDLNFNSEGFEQAKALLELASKIVTAFQSDDRYLKNDLASKDIDDQSDHEIKNPFL